MTLSVDLARRALAALTPAETFESSEGRSHAAVAAILRDAPNPGSDEPPTLEALFIKRATHEHDPWSGHMAFPGGRHERGDLTLLRTAMRETEEEVGLDLSTAELLGAPPPMTTASPSSSSASLDCCAGTTSCATAAPLNAVATPASSVVANRKSLFPRSFDPRFDSFWPSCRDGTAAHSAARPVPTAHGGTRSPYQGTDLPGFNHCVNIWSRSRRLPPRTVAETPRRGLGAAAIASRSCQPRTGNFT
jgi:hypothetical protein